MRGRTQDVGVGSPVISSGVLEDSAASGSPGTGMGMPLLTITVGKETEAQKICPRPHSELVAKVGLFAISPVYFPLFGATFCIMR